MSSPTNEPCKNKPEKWQVAHGMGHTRFEAQKKGVSVKATYFVGKLENALIWNLKVEIDPCLAPEMLPAKVTREFRGCRYEITITENRKVFVDHVEGRKQFTVEM